MARISGILRDPFEQPLTHVEIELSAMHTSAVVLANTRARKKTDENGRYDFDLAPGRYYVTVLNPGYPAWKVGSLTVYSNSTANDLNGLLRAPQEEPAPEWFTRIENETEAAKKHAETATKKANAATGAASTAAKKASAATEMAEAATQKAQEANESAQSAAAEAQKANTYRQSASSDATSAAESLALTKEQQEQAENHRHAAANSALLSKDHAEESARQSLKSQERQNAASESAARAKESELKAEDAAQVHITAITASISTSALMVRLHPVF